MKLVKQILRNVNVLNILLFAAAMSLFFIFDYPLLRKGVSVVQVEAKETPIMNEEQIGPESSPAYADFISIAEKNLFHPERQIPKSSEKVVIPKPELILYGTLITDDVSIAYVEDKKAPYSTPGRAKRQTALKKGSSIGGYVLLDVEPNRIVLVKGEDKLVVRLEDTEKRRASEEGTSPGSKGVGGQSTATFMPVAATPATAAPAFVPYTGAATSAGAVRSDANQGPAAQPGARRPGVEQLRTFRPQIGAPP